VNFNRPDYSDNAIDQEPFFFGYVGGNVYPSGFVVHHADYVGRTTNVPQSVLNGIKASGFLQDLPLSILPNNSSGDVYGPLPASQQEAIRFSFNKAKELFGELLD